MTLHYHGTPITPKASLQKLAGRNFCVSFAAPSQVKLCHEIGQSVMLDNGAFSFWRSGKPTNWPKFYRWCEPWLAFRTTWAVIPDVIDGTEEENDALVKAWPFGPSRGAPVWHLHESIERLQRLLSTFPKVCFGSSGQYASVGTTRWHERMTLAFNTIVSPDGTPPAWCHMLRGMKLCESHYPFASVDSTDVARNHYLDGEVVRRAQRWDAKQTPAVWVKAHEQQELIA